MRESDNGRSKPGVQPSHRSGLSLLLAMLRLGWPAFESRPSAGSGRPELVEGRRARHFPENSPISIERKIPGRTQIEKSDRSREIAPEVCEFAIDRFPEQNHWTRLRLSVASCRQTLMITGQECRRSLYDCHLEWHRMFSMYEVRDLRRTIDLGQGEFAALLSVPLETFRP